MARKKVRKVAKAKPKAKKVVKAKKVAKYMRTKVPKQYGKTNTAVDKKLPAKPVGWRKSANGRRYYEARANRSDRNQKRRL